MLEKLKKYRVAFLNWLKVRNSIRIYLTVFVICIAVILFHRSNVSNQIIARVSGLFFALSVITISLFGFLKTFQVNKTIDGKNTSTFEFNGYQLSLNFIFVNSIYLASYILLSHYFNHENGHDILSMVYYFTTIITTTGFGDLYPHSGFTKFLSLSHQLYLVISIGASAYKMLGGIYNGDATGNDNNGGCGNGIGPSGLKALKDHATEIQNKMDKFLASLKNENQNWAKNSEDELLFAFEYLGSDLDELEKELNSFHRLENAEFRRKNKSQKVVAEEKLIFR